MKIIRPVIKRVFYAKNAFLERSLPGEGRISVKVGDRVKPFDVLATSFLSLSKKSWRLSLKEWRVLVSDGDSRGSGDLIAKKKSLIPLKTEGLKMPFDGSVNLSSEKSFLKIAARSNPERFNLISGIEAVISKIIDKNSLLLSTEAYLVAGAVSSGREIIGEIRTVGNFDSPLLLSDLEPGLAGKIVVAGSYVSPDALSKAQALGVGAVVAGGVSPQGMRTGLPVLATEGFGRIPMNKKVWDFLFAAQLKTAVVVPFRRQVIVPFRGGDEFKLGENREPVGELKEGSCVQIFSWPYFGYPGVVAKLSSAAKKFPSGIEDLSAGVSLPSGETLDVPVSNLAILD